jgi:VIT1/CCC1 family predicted Fe2+/Mn2+ transporter
MAERPASREAENAPPDDALPRCGALVLGALLANDGITGIQLDPKTRGLALRYDPRRTTQERVEEIADRLRPVLKRPANSQPNTLPVGRTSGLLDGRPYLVPASAQRRIGPITVQPEGELVAPAPTSGAATPAGDENTHAFLLKVVQPGLVGLMDGSVSTLAPLFATAYATHNHQTALLVGLASAVGAGISMGFAEALSDDGVLTGRGLPWVRGGITGGMTFVGGVGHSLPFLIPNIHIALIIAYFVVGIELIAISLIRTKYFSARFVLSAIQVIVGGALVFIAGVLIGSA